MNYFSSNLIVNNKIRNILIVSDTSPITFSNPEMIQNVQEAEDTVTTTTYLTDGSVFRHYEKDGTHYYWFLVKSKSVQQQASKKALDEQKAINDILTGGDGTGTYNGGREIL